MRSFLIAFAGLMLIATGVQAKVAITVDKDNQQMTVAVDGVERYRWPVSTGIPSYETPNGSFRTFRMVADHYSKDFADPLKFLAFCHERGAAGVQLPVGLRDGAYTKAVRRLGTRPTGFTPAARAISSAQAPPALISTLAENSPTAVDACQAPAR